MPNANAAKGLLFVKRHKDVLATAQEIEDAFDRVKNANLPTNTKGTAFRNLTHIEITEKRAELEAVTKMREFLRLLNNTYFPDFKTYPVAAKMGHLDLAYNAGARGTRDHYPKFAAAVLRRNWKQAGIEQRTSRRPDRADIAQAWFNQAARQEPFFISHTNCKNPLGRLLKP